MEMEKTSGEFHRSRLWLWRIALLNKKKEKGVGRRNRNADSRGATKKLASERTTHDAELTGGGHFLDEGGDKGKLGGGKGKTGFLGSRRPAARKEIKSGEKGTAVFFGTPFDATLKGLANRRQWKKGSLKKEPNESKDAIRNATYGLPEKEITEETKEERKSKTEKWRTFTTLSTFARSFREEKTGVQETGPCRKGWVGGDWDKDLTSLNTEVTGYISGRGNGRGGGGVTGLWAPLNNSRTENASAGVRGKGSKGHGNLSYVYHTLR